MRSLVLYALCIIAVCTTTISRAEERADQFVRDLARLDKVTKIAIIPVVSQVRFDRDDRIPDPARIAARVTAVTRLADLLEEKLKGHKPQIVPAEATTLLLKENKWHATDLYVTTRKSGWDLPVESLKNHKNDQASLLSTRNEMKKTPDQFTLYRFRWHDLPEDHIGLASFKMSAMAPIDMEKAKVIAEKTGADALLYCQVADMETHEAPTVLGALVTGEKFKSTRVHVHCTLVTPGDGAIVWQAHAKGVKSQKTGTFTGTRAFNGEDRKVIEGAVHAVEMLVADLYDGAGKPSKIKD